ncbi:MAG TPA: Ig-like domain-containing protein, partial [Terriglobales bacterium]|nr:Ig-like domain-containing protein [Terriglobales bacterium]
MNVASRDNRSGAVPVRLCAAIVGLAVGPLLGFAVAPDWWTQRGVISPNVSAKDYAVVNQGQLKNIAAAAAAELDAHLPGGAGDTLHNLIENWSQPNTQRNDFAPVNLGQVKNVAKGFYDRLISIRYVDDYPWAANTNASDDFAISNIGQVKNLFSFDLLATDVAHDSDQNGLPDWWEKYYFGHIGLDPNALAPRGDGLTILQAFQQGLDPITNSSTGITLTPHGVNAVVNARQSSSVSVVARNSSDQIRQLRATVAGNSVDELKYTDSDEEGGPPFIWNDISATGTHLERVSNADDDFESFAISFAFPYFGNSYSTVFVSSNGFVTLGEGSSDYKNNFLPDVSAPANEIAAFHNDLNLGDSGDVYYQDFGDRVIIQFTNAARYEGDGVSTFQIVLQRGGAILFYYKEMTGTLDEALVGIQNDTKDKGLTVAFRESYLKNNLAVRIVTSTSWVTVAPADFVLAPGESKTLGLNFDATAIDSGNFQGTLQVQDDTLAAQASINMTVNEGPEVAVTSPESGWVFLEGDSIELKARARDLDGVAKVEFYDSQNLLGESVSTNQLSFTWNSPSVGSHSIIARAVDNRGAAARSTAIQLYVQSDSNHNGIGDDWEMQYFGNLNQTADGDFDGDGLSNRQEFLSHTNPTLADTDGDGVSDGDEVNIYHTDARSSDSDHDGMDDGYEIHHHLNPNADDTHLDNDGDGLTNFEEFVLGTDPEKWDTDGDGVSDKDDGWPLNKAVAPPPVPLMQYAIIDVSKTRIWGVNNSPDGLAYYPVDRVPVAVSVGDEFPGSYHSNNRLIFPLVFNDDDQIAGAFIQGDENGYFGNSQPWPVHAIIGDSPPILLCGETIHFSFSGIESYVTAFNTRGQVIVRSWVCPSGSPRDEALLASAGGLADDLGQVTGNLKLNNQGVVAASVNFQGLLIKNQQRVALPGWPAALTNEDAEGKETVVGYYDANDALYLWRDGIDGGVPLFDSHVNVAAAINSRLQIVGRTFLANTEVAALWENNRAYNFNDLISNPSEWTVNTATQINDRGMIFAQATHHLVSGPVPKITLVDVVLVPVELMVDANRDGEMSSTDGRVHDRDITSQDRPYRFWLNDDDDTETGPDEAGGDATESERVPAVRPDYSLRKIVSKRNLEDFARLWIHLGAYQDAIADRSIQIGLRWKNVTPGTTPAINIYPSADGKGSGSYVKDDNAASDQITGVFNDAVTDKSGKQTVDTNGTFIFKSDYWSGPTADNPTKCLLFEGAAEGKGELEIVFLDQNGTELGSGGGVWLDLKNI